MKLKILKLILGKYRKLTYLCKKITMKLTIFGIALSVISGLSLWIFVALPLVLQGIAGVFGFLIVNFLSVCVIIGGVYLSIKVGNISGQNKDPYQENT